MGLFKRHFNFDKQQFERIWLLSKIDYKIRFYENELGMAWAMVKPLSEMVIYYIVFVLFLNRGGQSYYLYLFLGLIFWNVFIENSSGKITILRDKRYLYEYSNMNKWEIYSSSVLSSFIGLIFNIGVYLIIGFTIDRFLLHHDFYVSWHIVYLPLFFIGTFFISLAFSVLLSSIFVVVRDIHQIWQVVAQILFWVSPTVYDSGLYAKYTFAIFIHPMAAVIIGVRNVFFEHKNPDPILFLAMLVNIIFYTLVAIFFFDRYGKLAAEKL